MSYGVSAALQRGLYETLSADPTLTGLVGSAIYDMAPTGAVPSLYVTLGPEDVDAADDKTGRGALHRITVSVVADTTGFQSAKAAAVAVSDALDGARPALSRGSVVWSRFRGAQARRTGSGNKRRIDLRFQVRVEDDV